MATKKSDELDPEEVLQELIRRGRELSSEEFAEFCEELAEKLEDQAAASREDSDGDESEDDE